ARAAVGMRPEADRPAHRRVSRRHGAGRLLAFGRPAAAPRPPAPSHVDHRPLPLLLTGLTAWLDCTAMTLRGAQALACATNRNTERRRLSRPVNGVTYRRTRTTARLAQ